MAPRGFDSDAMDIAMLQAMYRDGSVNLAGIDPRLNASRVAKSLKVGRARVAARLRSWKTSGFLRKYDVWVNPALLGFQGAWVALQVEHPRVKSDLFRRIALVDGVVAGMDFVGDWISVGLVVPDSNALARRAQLLRNLSGVRDLEGPVHWRVSEPKRRLTALDVRIVRALRAAPTATLSEIARQVGISTRTMTRRYGELVEDWAVWFVPMFDFRALDRTVVSVNLGVEPGTRAEDIGAALRTRYPLTLDFASTSAGPELPPEELVFFTTLDSAAHLEDLEQYLSTTPGVRRVDLYILVQLLDFPEWFDRHLDSLLPAASPAPVRSTTRARARRRSAPGRRTKRT